MGVHAEGISAELAEWIRAQPLFFVATAPLAADGHVNVSPKGLDTLRVLDSWTVTYLDLTGSGNETAAHLTENGRITLMFCAFDGRPRILRLFGRGTVVLPGHPDWAALRGAWPAAQPGVRQIMRVAVDRVATSCGFGVPLMTPEGQRETLPQWARDKGEAQLGAYRARKNAVSIDGLAAPGFPSPLGDSEPRQGP